MSIKQRIDETLNWNYVGLAAGILSVVVTFYNISNYWNEIKKVEKQ